jgi:hypothetical protein
MTYAFTQDVPINEDLYRRIVASLGDEVPDGLVVHVAVKRPEGGLRYLDVWRSEADWDRFADLRLHPVVHPLLGAQFTEGAPPEPDRVPQSLVDVWGQIVGRNQPLETDAGR